MERSVLCRSRRELSHEYLVFTCIYLQNLASIQPSIRTPPVPSVFEDNPVYLRRRRERASQRLPKISQTLEKKLEKRSGRIRSRSGRQRSSFAMIGQLGLAFVQSLRDFFYSQRTAAFCRLRPIVLRNVAKF